MEKKPPDPPDALQHEEDPPLPWEVEPVGEPTSLEPVLVEGKTLPQALTTETVDQFIRAVVDYKRFVAAIFSLTQPNHWINHGSESDPHLYLQAPGIEALRIPLGITYERPSIRKEIKETTDGEIFYAYWVEGIIESKLLDSHGWYIGYCDSLDQFFRAMPGWDAATGEATVIKSAISNWFVNGVSRMAGIRSPDPKLLQAAGVDISRIARISYESRKTPADDKRLISEARVKRLWGIARSGHNMPAKILLDHLAEKYGYVGPDGQGDATKIENSTYDEIVKWVESGTWKTPIAKGNGGSDARKQ